MKSVVIFFIIFGLCGFGFAAEPQVKVMFSPRDDCAREIVSEIDKAKTFIYVAMYTFTSRQVAQALLRARKRGVDVKLCSDSGQTEYKYSKVGFLENKGVPTKLIDGSGYMHNKFCVIDGATVITGSYNWTVSADLRNNEDLLIIKSAEIAKQYKRQFGRLWTGTFVDTCEYKDRNRLEKVPVE